MKQSEFRHASAKAISGAENLVEALSTEYRVVRLAVSSRTTP